MLNRVPNDGRLGSRNSVSQTLWDFLALEPGLARAPQTGQGWFGVRKAPLRFNN
jgi:hypothetical protein